MNKNPILFGFPLWKNIDRKIAKREIKRWHYKTIDMYRWAEKVYVNGKPFTETKVGDLVNDCSGFNVEIAKLIPNYYPYKGGKILMDVEIVTTNSGTCSMKHCGVEPARERNALENSLVKFYTSWYNIDDFDNTPRHIRDRVELHKFGLHFTDQDGCALSDQELAMKVTDMEMDLMDQESGCYQ